MANLRQSVRDNIVTYESLDLEAGIGIHAHPPGSDAEHTTECLIGAICVYIYPDQIHILLPNEQLVFDSTKWHGIFPLVLPCAFRNVARGRLIADYDTTVVSPHEAPAWAVDDARNHYTPAASNE